MKGFLGLSGYYKRFFKHYGVLAKPLTDLLSKNKWKWNEQATQAFQKLKKVVCSALALAVPEFKSEFHIDIDACSMV